MFQLPKDSSSVQTDHLQLLNQVMFLSPNMSNREGITVIYFQLIFFLFCFRFFFFLIAFKFGGSQLVLADILPRCLFKLLKLFLKRL